MSGKVDERVVGMTFDNGNFKKNAGDTISMLDKLKSSLNMDGAKKGLSDLSDAGKRFSLQGIAEGVDGIASKFTALSIIGITALANIASKAVDVGIQLVKSLTIDPISAGLQEYETGLTAIQTILANTKSKGEGLESIGAALQTLNDYSDKTIYNFGQMTDGVKTLTTSGLELQPAVDTVKGFANAAALAGVGANEMASALKYGLNQAMTKGKMMTQDWMSLETSGIAGEGFRNAIMETARVQGVNVDKIIKKNGSFRDSLKDGWLTSEILSETLRKYTGELSDAQLKSMGYSKDQIKAIQETAAAAVAAAQDVKTGTQLIDTLKESVGSGWAKTWQIVFGDLEDAKKLWTGLNNVISPFISTLSDARNMSLTKIFGKWRELGGVDSLLRGISNTFEVIARVLRPIKDAFSEVFPPMTGERLFALTESFANFTEKLKMGEETADNLKRTFKGVFAFFSIIGQVVKGLLGVFSGLFSQVGDAAGGVLSFTAKIGDWLVSVNEALKKGTALKTFFSNLAAVIQWPIDKLKEAVQWFKNLFNGDIDTSGFAAVFQLIGDRLAPVVDLFKKGASAIKNFFSGDGTIASGENPIVKFINNLSETLFDAVQSMDYSSIFDALSAGLIVGLIVMIKKFLKGNPITKLVDGLVGGFKGGIDRVAGSVANIFDTMTSTLKTMQQQIKAKTLLMIAGAVLMLAASAVALSMVDSKKLAVAMGALTGMFAQLVVSLKLLESSVATKGMAKLPVIATGLILLAVAVNILTIAVTRLAKLDWEGLGKGLAGVGALLGMIIGLTYALPKDGGPRMAALGFGLIILSTGLRIMTTSVIALSTLDWVGLAKGLLGVAALLGMVIGLTYAMPASGGAKLILIGAGLVILSLALKMMAGVVTTFAGFDVATFGMGIGMITALLGIIAIFSRITGNGANLLASAVGLVVLAQGMKMLSDVVTVFAALSWEQLGKGMAGLAGALLIIAGAMHLMPKNMLVSAASLVVVGYALGLISKAMSAFGGMDWTSVGKSMVMLAGSLAIIAGAMYLMSGALPGAAALIIVAGALMLMVPVLQALGAMQWEEIGKGLVALAGVFLVLGVAALVLTPVVPIILALGIAIGLLGIGLMAIGAAVLLFAMGMTALAALGAVGAAALTLVITAILSLIPLALQKLGEGIVAFAKVIGESGPVFVEAMTTLIMSILTTIQNVAPEIQRTFLMLIARLLQTIVVAVPMFVVAAIKLMTGILEGIAKNIGKVIDAGADLIVQFLKGIGRNIPKVLTAAADLIIDFLNGIADTIDKKSGEIQDAGLNIAKAIIKGMTSGLTKGISAVTDAAKNVAKGALNGAKKLLGINSPSKEFDWIGEMSVDGFINPFMTSTKKVMDATGVMGNAALDGLKDSMAGISDVVDTNMELNPVIAPVLDLTAIKKGAGEIDTLVTPSSIDVNGTYSRATAASTAYQSNKDLAATMDSTTEAPSTNVLFNQTINSPKDPNPAEIYRQSKNLISAAKGALEKKNA